MKRTYLRFLLPLLAVVWVSLAQAGSFFIHDGDRVVFLGDSITEQRLYTTYIEAYALTRFPDWKLTFRNVGWGGDTAWLRQRSHPNEGELFAAGADAQQSIVEKAVGNGLERDVLPLKPTVVTIKFGMNDHSYQPFREDIFRAYVRSQTELGKTLKANGARVAYLTPQPIEDKRPDPDQDVRNQSLRKFSDGLKEVAGQVNAVFVDQFDPYMAIMMRERSSNPTAMIGGGDAVHPGPPGHTIMAWAVLKRLGASALVSKAELDAAGVKLVSTENCKVSNVSSSASGGISFQRLDGALPMPVDPKAESALKLAPILDELNLYELCVTGLKPGKYQVIIDGEKAMEASSDEFAKGVNLATAAGPVTQQARQVLDLVFQKNNVFFNRWRQVQLFSFPAWAQLPELETKKTAELVRLDSQLEDLERQIEAARKPKARAFEVMPVQ
jgi:lysophospholipase L1-like esterase